MINPIEVKLYRPERRFGTALMVLGQDVVTGERYLQDFSGPDQWWKVDPTVEPPETCSLFIDDNVLKQIVDRWLEMHPEPEPELRVEGVLLSALEDTRVVRDRTLSMVENLLMRERDV